MRNRSTQLQLLDDATWVHRRRPAGARKVKARRPEGVLRSLMVGLAVLALSGLVASCQSSSSPSTQSAAIPQTVPQTFTAFKGALVSTVLANATVGSARRATLSFGIEGRIVGLDVSPGDEVKAGQQLASLDTQNEEVTVAQAESVARAARLKLELLRQGATSQAIAAANAAVEAARAKYDEVSAGPGKAELRAAQSEVTRTSALLAAAEARLAQLKQGPTEADVQAAQTSVETAKANLSMAKARLEAVKRGPSETEWGAALGAVDAARASLRAAEAKLQEVQAGSTEADIQAAEAAVARARSTETLVAAQGRLDLLRRMPQPADMESFQAERDIAKANLMAAEYRVDEMKAGVKPEVIQEAQAAVDAATAALTAAQAKQKQVTAGPSKSELVSAESDVTSARAALDSAQAKLDALQDGSSASDVQSAASALAGAQASLAAIASGPDATELALAEEEVTQAEIALQKAKLNVQSASLVAPFDGVVTTVEPGIGAYVRSWDPVLTLADPNATRIDATVSESDLPKLHPGQSATVSFEALGKRDIPGKVVSVVPSGTVQAKAVTYLACIEIDPTERGLPMGMSATVNIETERRENVLLVPTPAIQGTDGNRVVQVMVNGVPQQRPVKIGASNGQFTEILSGIDEGEPVVMQSPAVIASR